MSHSVMSLLCKCTDFYIELVVVYIPHTYYNVARNVIGVKVKWTERGKEPRREAKINPQNFDLM